MLHFTFPPTTYKGSLGNLLNILISGLYSPEVWSEAQKFAFNKLPRWFRYVFQLTKTRWPLKPHWGQLSLLVYASWASCIFLPSLSVREAVMLSGMEGNGQAVCINLCNTCPALSSTQSKALCPWLHRHKILSQVFMCYHIVKVPHTQGSSFQCIWKLHPTPLSHNLGYCHFSNIWEVLFQPCHLLAVTTYWNGSEPLFPYLKMAIILLTF